MDDNGPSHIYTFNPMKEFIHPVTTHHVDHEFEMYNFYQIFMQYDKNLIQINVLVSKQTTKKYMNLTENT